jgi:hypothetical protein
VMVQGLIGSESGLACLCKITFHGICLAVDPGIGSVGRRGHCG